MIPEMLHPVRAGRFTRPVTMKLALTVVAMAALWAPEALAQAHFDSGTYTSVSTPQARAQQNKQKRDRETKEGIVDLNGSEGIENIPELQVFAAVNLAEIYTSNASGSSGGNRGYDFYTRPGIRLGAVEQTAHLTATLDYSLTGQYHARNHDLDQLINRLNAMANAELINETLFLDLQARAKPTSLTRTGALTADDGSPTNNNYRSTYAYSARPTLMHQFGRAVETDLWFSQSGVYFVTPSSAGTSPLPGFYRPPTNSNTSSVGARISSLDDFVRLKWSLNASASDTYQSAHRSQKQRSATANVSFAVVNGFSLIGTGGYQTYHSSNPLTKNLDGPTLLGGFQFAPSPDFYLYVQAGTQNNFPTYIGSLRWAITPITTATASATDQVQTPQQRLLGDLQNPGDLSGGGTNPPPGSTPPDSVGSGDISSDGLSLDNSIYRYRQLRATITRSTERMRYQLSAYGTLRDQLDVNPLILVDRNSKTYGIRGDVLRKLRRDLDATLGFSVSHADEFSGHDRIIEGDAGMNFNASDTLSFYFNTSVLKRHSEKLIGFSNGDLTDVRVTIGVNKSF